jgi:hypothetical protein
MTFCSFSDYRRCLSVPNTLYYKIFEAPRVPVCLFISIRSQVERLRALSAYNMYNHSSPFFPLCVTNRSKFGIAWRRGTATIGRTIVATQAAAAQPTMQPIQAMPPPYMQMGYYQPQMAQFQGMGQQTILRGARAIPNGDENIWGARIPAPAVQGTPK